MYIFELQYITKHFPLNKIRGDNNKLKTIIFKSKIMKILIDTNIFLDFYRSNNHAMNIFSELINHTDKIILTDQIIQEFDRSRENVIKKVRDNFRKESELENFSSSYVQDLKEFKDLLNIKKEYKLKLKEVNDKINQILYDPSIDPIASYFKNLVDDCIKKDLVLHTTDKIIKKANNRKLIGNPPTSDKHSIGDEINWEIILANVQDDIIIVGRDNTYNNNFAFLKSDYYKHTGCFIHSLTQSITSALEAVGIQQNPQLIDEEKKFIKEIESRSDFWKY